LFDSIVEFATYGDMKNVITKLDDTEINGRRIRIVEQKPRGRRQQRYDVHVLGLYRSAQAKWNVAVVVVEKAKSKVRLYYIAL